MNHRNRNVLWIAGVALLLAVLACGPSSDDMPPTPTAAGQAGVTPTDTPVPDAPADSDTPTPELAGPGGCTFDSGYVADVTVPDDTPFPPNTPFVKTWRVQNTGSCDWEAGTKLVYVAHDPLGGPASVDVPPTVAGANVDISVNFGSPGSPGTYRSTSTDTPVPTNTPEPTTTLVAIAPPPMLSLWHTYRPGDYGPPVYAIQYLLRAKGYTLSVDGNYGPQTEGVVKSFQGDEGLTIDGIVGPNTWGKLVQGNTVKMGNSGDGVRAAQYLLRHMYMYSITVDGSFGPNTNTAVRDFQESYGLTVDGIVGQNTWRALVAD